MDDGSSSRDGNRGNDKRLAQSFIDKLREPKRGVGIAKLEKMRAEEAMKEKCLKDPSSREHISGDGIAGIQCMALMDGSSSSDGNRGNGKRPAQSSIDKPRKRKRGVGIAKMMEEEAMKARVSGPAGIGGIRQGMISYETNGNMSVLHILPFARPPSTSGGADSVNPNTSGAAGNINPSDTTPRTLQLFPDHMEDEQADSKREGDHNLPVEPTCKNSDDQHDLDLDLKL
ncbi:unnamed protein product [Urochloa decumbens]|uniref:Uncharacterized protein n=1 Tax=Urochloa decumbens TaxID=240449 RepID=A0ABC8WH78_9POAL